MYAKVTPKFHFFITLIKCDKILKNTTYDRLLAHIFIHSSLITQFLHIPSFWPIVPVHLYIVYNIFNLIWLFIFIISKDRFSHVSQLSHERIIRIKVMVNNTSAQSVSCQRIISFVKKSGRKLIT